MAASVRFLVSALVQLLQSPHRRLMIEADVPDMDDRPTRGELIWSRLAASPKFATAVRVAPPASSAKPKTAD